MREQETKILKLIAENYPLDHIKEEVKMETQEIFSLLITILERKLNSMKTTTNKELNGVATKIYELIETDEIKRKRAISDLKKIRKQICALEIDETEPYLIINDGITILKSKLEKEKKFDSIEDRNKALDKIVFSGKNYKETLKLLKDTTFDIDYINNTNLLFRLIDEYTTKLKNGTSIRMTNYYQNTITGILALPQFKIKNQNVLNCQITKIIEKTKRDKKIKNKKMILEQLTAIAERIKFHEVPLFVVPKRLHSLVKQKDFTNEYTITIDRYNTKIYDDALTIKPLINGNYLLGIHIADINSQFKYKPEINQEMLKQINRDKNSTMLETHVFNEHPPIKKLSLNKNEPRATNSLLVEITPTGEVVDYQFVKGQIKVNENLVYNHVLNYLKSKTCNEQLHNTLTNLILVTSTLREKNSIKDIYVNLKILSDKKEPLHHKPFTSTIDPNHYGYMIVQEAMILYNGILASHFAKYDYPFIFTNCEPKDSILLNDNEVNKVINQLKELGHTPDKIIKALINFYPKMEYSTTNLGNSILQLPSYCNSTSPLRKDIDKLTALSLDKCYFNNPKDIELYSMEKTYKLLAKRMTKKKHIATDEETVNMKKHVQSVLKEIRKD